MLDYSAVSTGRPQVYPQIWGGYQQAAQMQRFGVSNVCATLLLTSQKAVPGNQCWRTSRGPRRPERTDIDSAQSASWTSRTASPHLSRLRIAGGFDQRPRRGQSGHDPHRPLRLPARAPLDDALDGAVARALVSAYAHILDALAGHGYRIHRTGDRARAQCPVHGSRGLTLALRAGDGRAIVHCFAGCSDEDVLDALGLAVRDLFDDPKKQIHAGYSPEMLATPWDELMRRLGLHTWPSIDHVCRRMLVEELKRNMGPDLIATMTDDELNILLSLYVFRECDEHER